MTKDNVRIEFEIDEELHNKIMENFYTYLIKLGLKHYRKDE